MDDIELLEELGHALAHRDDRLVLEGADDPVEALERPRGSRPR